MTSNRRRFIQSLGLTLASLVVAGQLPACASESSNQDEPSFRSPEWDELRQCWLNLDELNVAVQSGNWGEEIEAKLDEREATHRAVLETLVAAGELNSNVAAQMQLAFDEAIDHVSQSMALCYMFMPFEAQVRGDLFKQADLLQEVAADLDPTTVAQARAAIARDMAFFQAVTTEGVDRQLLQQQYGAGQLDVSPEALEAARILVELLLEPGE